MRLLEVEAYHKQFNIHHLGREIGVFEALNFTLDAGQFLLVTGRNGAGKSSLLRCLYRTYMPTGGCAWYASLRGTIDLVRAADVDIALLRRAEIGFVTQFLRPRPRVSALELVAEPLLLAGESWDTARQQAQSILEEFGLKPQLWDAYPSTFSGGEQQKVNLARALIRPYRLLLLDEPTASLDQQTHASLAERLAQLKAQGVAMIAVFHHTESIRHLVDAEVQMLPPAANANIEEEEVLHVAE